MSLMCAYKLCRVEFRYWGMQTKLEKFIHDTALRKTMQRAHCQAWAWQDEWHGLTMDDIREIERQTQLALKQKMQALEEAEASGGGGGIGGSNSDTMMAGSSSGGSTRADIPSTPVINAPSEGDSSEEEDDDGEESTAAASSSLKEDKPKTDYFGKSSAGGGGLYSGGSKNTLHSPLGSAHSFDLQVI